MVLVDTSVWFSHLRDGNNRLAELLNDGEVACHPFIVGELACGNLRNRIMILTLLESLPMTVAAEHEEVLTLIENKRLMGKGVGYVDVHLIASALLTGLSIWTLDSKLNRVADHLQIKYQNIK